jgi:NAD(P)-dependent dehydrogenase (short-subunit alcohol dehydrogenase family)
MVMTSWLVTGANRGIGLELVRQLAHRGDAVDAAARDLGGARELQELAKRHAGKVHLHRCDVRDEASVRAMAEAVGDRAVDVVINNAGVMGKMLSLEDVDCGDALATFDANALGPLRVTRAFLPHLGRADRPRVVQISSGMGSIGDNSSGGAYAYRMSKAALNMANRSMSVDLSARRICCVVINPGWVQTDMGGHGAPTPVEESVSKMVQLFDRLTIEDTGSFLDYRGGRLDW